jgi:hypothetical protein
MWRVPKHIDSRLRSNFAISTSCYVEKKTELRKELDSLEQMEEIAELSPTDVVKKTQIMVELFNIHAEEESY